jgi:8-oxo-dGTP diphosphatase
MPLLLLRHATAGRRRSGPDDDSLRPLDERGRSQARALPELYADRGVERVLTSPFVRCRTSVEPLAASLGLPVEDRHELAEGVSESEVAALVHEVAGSTAVLCTHGDVLGLLLGEEPEKGSTWIVEAAGDGALSRLEYLEPPA